MGAYNTGNGILHGFIYDGVNYTTFDHPNTTSYTAIHSISGNKIVGGYEDTSGIMHGFIFDGINYHVLNDPTPNTWFTTATGISGQNVVGYAISTIDHSNKSHGYLFDGTNYETLLYPGSSSTGVMGIEGNKIVGSYRGDDGNIHGFLASPVPIPAAVWLLGSGLLGLIGLRRKFKK